MAFNFGRTERSDVRGREERPSGLFDFRRTGRCEARGGEGRRQPTFDSYTENTLQYYPDRCINCKRCTQVCPHGVFAEGPDHAELVRPASCMECGACALNCPVQAIEVQSGVGCAWAMIGAALRGKDMDTECCCGGEDSTCCGGSAEDPACNCGGR